MVYKFHKPEWYIRTIKPLFTMTPLCSIVSPVSADKSFSIIFNSNIPRRIFAFYPRFTRLTPTPPQRKHSRRNIEFYFPLFSFPIFFIWCYILSQSSCPLFYSDFIMLWKFEKTSRTCSIIYDKYSFLILSRLSSSLYPSFSCSICRLLNNVILDRAMMYVLYIK